MRTPCSANCRSHRVIRLRVVEDVTSRSICSDQSAVPNDVQIRSSRPVSPIVTVEKGASGLRRKIRATSSAGGSSAGPDLVEGDEQIAVRRGAAVAQEVFELPALARDVIDHQVEQDVVMLGEPADVVPRAEARVDLVVASAARTLDRPMTETVAARARRGRRPPAGLRGGRRASGGHRRANPGTSAAGDGSPPRVACVVLQPVGRDRAAEGCGRRERDDHAGSVASQGPAGGLDGVGHPRLCPGPRHPFTDPWSRAAMT